MLPKGERMARLHCGEKWALAALVFFMTIVQVSEAQTGFPGGAASQGIHAQGECLLRPLPQNSNSQKVPPPVSFAILHHYRRLKTAKGHRGVLAETGEGSDSGCGGDVAIRVSGSCLANLNGAPMKRGPPTSLRAGCEDQSQFLDFPYLQLPNSIAKRRPLLISFIARQQSKPADDHTASLVSLRPMGVHESARRTR